MVRDIETAREIVAAVMEPLMASSIGDLMVDVAEMSQALNQSVMAVANLLDPDEQFDVEVKDPCPDGLNDHGIDKNGRCAACDG